jgi:hypothetical protein
MPHIDRRQVLFLEISAILTGFSETELKGTGMAKKYYETLVAKTEPSTLDLFFDKVEDVLAMPPHDQHIAIPSQLIPDSSYNGSAKKIILMWYEGMWVDGAKGIVISSQAFVESLMWPASHTHPSGAKQPGFGSWSDAPITVEK